MHNACINCHAMTGTVATGRFGPDLTHLASRETRSLLDRHSKHSGESAQVDRRSELDEARLLMPAMHLNDHDLDVITAYLTQLRLTFNGKVSRMSTTHAVEGIDGTLAPSRAARR
jgi:cytochrome c oxidase subunit II